MKITQKQFAQALYLASRHEANHPQILKRAKNLIVKYRLSKQRRQIVETLQNIEENHSPKKQFLIKTAHRLNAQELDQIEQYLSRQTTKKVVLKQMIEPTLSGIIIQSRYYEFNNSVEHKLQQLIKAA